MYLFLPPTSVVYKKINIFLIYIILFLYLTRLFADWQKQRGTRLLIKKERKKKKRNICKDKYRQKEIVYIYIYKPRKGREKKVL